ncbi:MAG: DUF6364 family protein [Nitrospirota bacterium]
MSTKLTLRLDSELIKNAKKIARSKGVSLSTMVADYFKSVAAYQKKTEVESPVLSEVSGILSPKSDNKKLRNRYKKHLEDKYL